MNNKATFTYQTRLNLDPHLCSILNEYAVILSRVEHKLFAEIASGNKASNLKKQYLKKYDITARQFNACRVNVEGKIASIKVLRDNNIANLKSRIEILKKKIKKIKNKFVIHQKKRSLIHLENKLEKLQRDKKNNVIRMCFGSKKFFHKQFHLSKNGYKNHEEWRDDWVNKRSSNLFALGSKDETAGNQTCKLKLNDDGSFSIQLRLPRLLEAKYGKTIIISNISLSYGCDAILAALVVKQAISYRFVRDRKGWRFLISTNLHLPEIMTNKSNGAIGVDINADHLAISETDKHGNVVKIKTIPLVTYGKNSNQTKALIGDACVKIVNMAIKSKKPLVIEKLDFQKKKRLLRYNKQKYARMLSSLAYNTIKTFLKSRAMRYGVEVNEVNPAYTSVIGSVNFKNRYGLSGHCAAALCIARRYLGFSEKPSPLFIKFLNEEKYRNAPFLPVRNRKGHVWYFWSWICKKNPAALAAHFWANNRSLGPPVRSLR